MEHRLGVRLLNRSTRKISLTPEGETYLEYASRLLAEMREMDEVVSGSKLKPQGLLRVNAPLGFGRSVIGPLVARFINLYPDVEVQLEVTDKPVDLIEEGVDLSIRFGELPDTRINARRVMSNRRFIVASPAYLAKYGTPKTLDDLASHRCIVHRQNNEAYGIWRFIKDDRTEVIKVHGSVSSNDGDIVQQWALDGLGILIRSEWDITHHIEAGDLVRILDKYKLPSADLYAYYPSKQNLSARVRAFIDYLVEEMESKSDQSLNKSR